MDKIIFVRAYETQMELRLRRTLVQLKLRAASHELRANAHSSRLIAHSFPRTSVRRNRRCHKICSPFNKKNYSPTKNTALPNNIFPFSQNILNIGLSAKKTKEPLPFSVTPNNTLSFNLFFTLNPLKPAT